MVSSSVHGIRIRADWGKLQYQSGQNNNVEAEDWEKDFCHVLSPLREGHSSNVSVVYSVLMGSQVHWSQQYSNLSLMHPWGSRFRWRRGKMKAESGPINLPCPEAKNRPSAFHSSCTVKSFSAAYLKCMMTLPAEMRLGMPAGSPEVDAVSHLPRHCIIS